ncbi:hypothetical protein GCM10011344_04760 [Dokdonia pacifica]|uniref:Uncharacterized protein n=1 Tax=Dokdonia pacifica TaxID=1627892 RepID=A0A238ZLS6_9FLAO|nr:hypothetical protein [Dokdonia pacifica]GGG07273.1 hypothetical protein GCM10011344_04760 [Dokdonia pacifica]SNR84270.1 hypothetical protein SAMN06265376_103337 [Dokdonia pacifica]
MKENEEKLIDQVVSKAVQKVSVKSPSHDFTKTLMHTIKTAQASQTTIVYQPLISKRIWSLLAVVFALLIGFVGIRNIELTTVSEVVQKVSDKLPSFDVPTWELFSFDTSVETTSPFVYGAIILAGFLFLEIVILKRKYKW